MNTKKQAVPIIDRVSPVILVIVGFIYAMDVHREWIVAHWQSVMRHLVNGLVLADRGILATVINRLAHVSRVQLHSLSVYLMTSQYSQISLSDFVSANHLVGKVMLIILLPIMLFMIVLVARRNLGVTPAFYRYKSAVDFKQAVRQLDEKAGLNVTKETASALSPKEYCVKNLIVEVNDQDELTEFNQKQAFEVLARQLGSALNSSLLATQYSSVVDVLLKAIPLSEQDSVIKCAEKHHYVSTAIVSLYVSASRFAAISMIELHSLKRHYRALWYALISMGRQVAFIEGAAIVAQYGYECEVIKAGGVIYEKNITTLIPSLIEAIENEGGEVST